MIRKLAVHPDTPNLPRGRAIAGEEVDMATEDEAGNIWVATLKGINVLDPKDR